jgi:hypothetical protein
VLACLANIRALYPAEVAAAATATSVAAPAATRALFRPSNFADVTSYLLAQPVRKSAAIPLLRRGVPYCTWPAAAAAGLPNSLQMGAY